MNNTTDDFEAWLIDPLERLQSDGDRFERELDQVRSSLTQCYEQSLARLRDTRWVAFDAVSRLVEDLSADAMRERTRADALEADLEAAKQEVENVRALYEVSVTICERARSGARAVATGRSQGSPGARVGSGPQSGNR
jgi:hypothetical protein